MCSDRLAVGEAPACVQACPHEAISIAIVDIQQVIENAEADPFLPAAPDPQITLPTTHFRTSRVFPRNALPADYYDANPQHPHWPLIIMLVLTQLSVGAFIVGLVLDERLDSMSLAAFRQLHATSALGFGLLALASSTLHLGRPQYAFRAMLGLGHSWLSREILAFGLFAKTALLYAAACWIWPESELIGPLGYAVAITGVVGVFCSAMIYAATGRECWSVTRTMTKFVLTSSLLGIATCWLSIVALGNFVDSPGARQLCQQAGATLVQALLIAMTAKLSFEVSIFRHLFTRRNSPLKRSAGLLIGPLSNSTFARFALGLLGGIVMSLFLLDSLRSSDTESLTLIIPVGMLFLACLLGEVTERYQFFAACAALRMPGRLM
jgi:DMSO reductase anchor subunit